MPYLFFIHMSSSSLNLLPIKKKKEYRSIETICQMVLSILVFYSVPLFFFLQPSMRWWWFAIRTHPVFQYRVVWISIFCFLLVFKDCFFVCDIFIGGNRIFCVKFPLFGLCNRRCFDFLATIWLVLMARLGRITIAFKGKIFNKKLHIGSTSNAYELSYIICSFFLFAVLIMELIQNKRAFIYCMFWLSQSFNN